MNGISLAALLGAGTWFGSRLFDEDNDAGDTPRESAPASEPVPETDTRENEFLWPSGPMFQ